MNGEALSLNGIDFDDKGAGSTQKLNHFICSLRVFIRKAEKRSRMFEEMVLRGVKNLYVFPSGNKMKDVSTVVIHNNEFYREVFKLGKRVQIVKKSKVSDKSNHGLSASSSNSRNCCNISIDS